MPHEPLNSSRPRQRLLLAGDVHQNHVLATKLYMFCVYSKRHKSWGELYVQSFVLVGFIRSVLIFKMQRSTKELRTGHAALAVPPSTPTIPQPLPSPITTKASDGDPFRILKCNANGSGNQQVELGEFLERYKVRRW